MKRFIDHLKDCVEALPEGKKVQTLTGDYEGITDPTVKMLNDLASHIEAIEKKLEFVMENTDDGVDCGDGCCQPTSLKKIYQANHPEA